MLLDQRLVAMVGNGVEVEIEGGAGAETVVADGAVPRAHQPGEQAGIDPGAVFGERRALGHGVEAGKQRQAGIEHLGHGLRGPADAPELESQQGTPGTVRGDHGAARHGALRKQAIEIEGGEHRGEDKEPAEAGAERARLKAEGAAVGDRRGIRADDIGQHGSRAPRQPRQAGLADHLGHGRQAGRTVLGCKDGGDLVDRHLPLPPQLQDTPVPVPA